MATLLVVLLATGLPAYAQTATTSGATPQSTSAARPHTTSTTKLITPLTVVAPGLRAAGIKTCLGSASGGLSLMGTGLTLGGTTRRRMQHPARGAAA